MQFTALPASLPEECTHWPVYAAQDPNIQHMGKLVRDLETLAATIEVPFFLDPSHPNHPVFVQFKSTLHEARAKNSVLASMIPAGDDLVDSTESVEQLLHELAGRMKAYILETGNKVQRGQQACVQKVSAWTHDLSTLLANEIGLHRRVGSLKKAISTQQVRCGCSCGFVVLCQHVRDLSFVHMDASCVLCIVPHGVCAH
jgi:hypothetical protein